MTWARGSTRKSRALRARVLRAWPICYIQGPRCTQTSTRDDHVIPLGEGGTDDWDNHCGACQACHDDKSKTEAARGRARVGRKRTRAVEEHPGRISP